MIDADGTPGREVTLLGLELRHAGRPPAGPEQQTGVLADRLVGLAGTPDDSDRIGTDLIVVARLAATRIAAVDAASVTSRCQGTCATVAVSSDLAVTLDEAQYDDQAGPCLQALESGHPVAVTDISTAAAWPRFRDTARGAGLRASLSIPVFTGSGRTVAVLNLYSRRPDLMRTLSAAILDAYTGSSVHDWNDHDLDDGGRELTAGVIGALALRTMIQQAIRALTCATANSADGAYLQLRMQAAEAGANLVDTAAELIQQQSNHDRRRGGPGPDARRTGRRGPADRRHPPDRMP